ncbi:gametocyte-specific factor 1-like [Lampris incognitus]|uniref:gametocyte-specific factor 1-like n=1 Tax=Lampris incognitus TaxID=2546036 RepID=UPI0024B4F69B|nr:gametocyte-specific factor 1-like [Lampris incognitus]
MSASCGSNISPENSGLGEMQYGGKDKADDLDCDPDRLLLCPFDKNHQIRACRIPYHLIKCRKNHQKLANKLKTCPFNACHLVPEHELAHHIVTCSNRRSISDEGCGGNRLKWRVPISTWTSPCTEEDWDKETDVAAAAAPFVWGVSNALVQKMEANATNDLTPTFD